MAYFSNATEGMDYEEKYCSKCVHGLHECPILIAHAIYNYDDCNKPESILHILIPRAKDGIGNLKCRMWIPKMNN